MANTQNNDKIRSEDEQNNPAKNNPKAGDKSKKGSDEGCGC
jgi:hypothetical protein